MKHQGAWRRVQLWLFTLLLAAVWWNPITTLDILDSTGSSSEPVLEGPLKNPVPVMFWRLQKVGSSSIVALAASYAFRYRLTPRRKLGRNSLCKKVECCFPVTAFNSSKQMLAIVKAVYARKYGKVKGDPKHFDSKPFHFSLQHDLCFMDAALVQRNLPCAFQTTQSSSYPNRINEIFAVRDPVARAVSAYYFWGELFKLKREGKRRKDKDKSDAPQLGALKAEPMEAIFSYHGNESSVPGPEMARAYSSRLPFIEGNYEGSGPSYSYSAFAKTSASAVQEVRRDRMVTLVLERLDESLVVMAAYLQWSLADVVVAKARKTQSTHPAPDEWPKDGITVISEKLVAAGEVAVYDAANTKLDERIAALRGFEARLLLLRALRQNVTKLCFSEEYLGRYKAHMTAQPDLRTHGKNKLREVESAYTRDGHAFRYNGELLYSFDVCAACEAHAFELAGRPLKELDPGLAAGNINFARCPR